jgi:hypothetical protein
MKTGNLIQCALALAVVTLPVAGVSSAEAPDLKTLIECTDRAWSEDIAGWASYAFDRHVTRRSLDKEGEVSSVIEMRFRVTPQSEGFDEVLVQIDGRQPTPKEVQQHREKARFTNHYNQAEALELDNPLGENLALLPILREQDYRMVGEDEINGFRCYRVAYDARPAPQGASVREQLKYGVKGSACFSVQGCHLVDFEMETVRALKEGPFKMNHLRLSFEGQPVENDGWLLAKIELHSDVGVVVKKLHKYNTYRYTDFSYRPENP